MDPPAAEQLPAGIGGLEIEVVVGQDALEQAAGGQGAAEQQGGAAAAGAAAAQQQQQEAGGHQAGAAAGGAERGDEEGRRAAKRPRLGQPTFSYAPVSECDLTIRTADGPRLGVHRLIVLRCCGFFRDLLEACEGESEVRAGCMGGWAGEGAGMEGRGGAGGRETGAAAGRQGRGGLVLCCHYCRMLPPPPHCKHQIPA